jgi:carboxypeptidase Taq
MGDRDARREAWERFSAWMATLRDLDGVQQLLGWDQETLLPPAGAEGRAHRSGTVAALYHRELVRPDVEELIAALEEDPDLPPQRRAMVRIARRERRRALALPEDLVRAETELTARCTMVWREARDGEDFAAFARVFAPLLEVQREIAAATADGGEPYDALLDRYEPGARARDLEPLFADLCGQLAPIVAAARERPVRRLPERRWNAEAQLELTRSIARMVGFDERGGVIALSPHPFTCTPHRGDVRFSTHVDPGNPVVNVLVTLHELGHALYDQGFADEYDRTFLYEAPSLGAQESQSRFFEMHVGCSLSLWSAIAPEMRRLFPAAMEGIGPEDLLASATIVRPGPLRLEADEVTYNLHIALRFELELALLRGELAVDDLPDAWSERVERLLGVRPRGHRDGVLQDIHWAAGLVGYFPTYTLGNLYAAQLRAALEEELGDLEELVRRGELRSVLGFMRERVHRHGALWDTPELMRSATGRELRTDELVAHLRRRYLDG